MHDERIRLFVALELPEQVRNALASWRGQALGPARDLRLLDADSLHVTLCFLGSQAGDQVDAITAAMGVLSAESAAPLSIGDPRWLPPRRPRVLAVELHDPASALRRVQALLSDVLAAGGWYEPEKRPYLAHVTVARVARGERIRSEDLPPPRSLEFQGSRVTLFRSRLYRSGARYEALSTVELK